MKPNTKKWLIRGAVATAVVGTGAYLYVKSKTPPRPITPSPRNAVKAAIRILGEDEDPVELADLAYTLAYPKCPPKLDPDDPEHEDCIAKWLGLRDMALEEASGEKPARGGKKKQKPKRGEGPAKDMKAWLDGLTQGQRSGLRSIIGAKYYDPIEDAAEANDDSGTVSAVLRLERAIKQLMHDDPIEAFKQYAELKKLLGGKIDELRRKAQKYA